MNNGDTPPPASGLSLAPTETPNSDAQAAVQKPSRTDELLANSSLSLMPVDDEPNAAQEAPDDAVTEVQAEPPTPTEAVAETVPDVMAEAVAEIVVEEAPSATATVDSSETEQASAEIESVAVEVELELQAEADDHETAVVTPLALNLEPTLEPTLEPALEAPAQNPDEVETEAAAPMTLEPLTSEPPTPLTLEPIAEADIGNEAVIETAEPAPEELVPTAVLAPESLVETPAELEQASSAIDSTTVGEVELQLEVAASDTDDGRSAAIIAAENDAAALFAPTLAPVTTSVAEPEPAPTAESASPAPVAAHSTQEMPAITTAEAVMPVVPVITGKAVFEAKPAQVKEVQPELEIPPPPVKKLVIPPPEPSPPPPTAAEVKPEPEAKAKSAGVLGKIGAWKGHLNYLHTLYKEDPSNAVSVWKQSYKERDALSEALKGLQERQHADNFSWDEIPRVLGQFHLRDEDRGQADWYGDAARQYQLVLAALEKQKSFKPQLVQPLMKELKFIAEADAFHQKFGLSAVQQKVKTMYMTLQHRIDEYMKLQKQQLEVAVKDKEMEKLRAQEAIATAEAQKVAQENRLVQEQRLKVVEDKKRLEAKRAAEEAERSRIERQREIDAETAEVRRREELSASFRAIEQEDLMKKALQNMSLAQCAEGLLRQLFEKDNLSESEKAAAARVFDVLKAKLS